MRNIAEELSKVAQMSPEEAKEQLVKAMTDEARTTAAANIKEIMEEAKASANKEAKKVIQTIQRTAAEHAIENTVSVFHLENDEMFTIKINRQRFQPSSTNMHLKS